MLETDNNKWNNYCTNNYSRPLCNCTYGIPVVIKFWCIGYSKSHAPQNKGNKCLSNYYPYRNAFEYAINACGVAGDSFIKLFSVSSVSNRIENGEPSYLLGKSGIETAVDVLVETTGKAPTAKPQANFSRSREYWMGWAVAYYQWFSGRKFSDIFKVLSFEDLQQMYSPLHEADVTKFADIVDAKVREYFADTNLKRIRMLYGCTQAELAKRSNVSLRSIQMYEQHNKDINKASAETVLSLAKVLGCTMEDLLET